MKPLIAMALGLVLAACSGGKSAAPDAIASPEAVKSALTGVDPAAQQGLADLYLAARQAGEPGATVYIASVPEEFKPLTDEFARTFPGLKADLQRFVGDKLTARLDGEFGSGQHTGDVTLSSFQEAANMSRLGRLQVYEPPTLGQLDSSLRDAGKTYYVPYKKIFSLTYNTRLVSKDEVPQTIDDVLKPKWRGRYVAPGSGVAGAIDTALSLIMQEGRLTESQIADFQKYGAVGPPSSELLPQVAQGRYAFAVWINASAALAQKAEGAPLDVSYSRDLTIQTSVNSGILSKAPHPNSAKLFVAWLFTPRAQQILASLHFYAAQPGSPLPPNTPPLSAVINGAQAETPEYFARIKAFRERRIALAAAHP